MACGSDRRPGFLRALCNSLQWEAPGFTTAGVFHVLSSFNAAYLLPDYLVRLKTRISDPFLIWDGSRPALLVIQGFIKRYSLMSNELPLILCDPTLQYMKTESDDWRQRCLFDVIMASQRHRTTRRSVSVFINEWTCTQDIIKRAVYTRITT